MFTLLLPLLLSPYSEAKPKAPPERFPPQFVRLLQQGGWTPTPTNSGRYQIGDVFNFTKNEKILSGEKCFTELPAPAPMADMNIINMLKKGLTVPFGVFKGKAKGKRYKKSTFANTEVRELSKMELETSISPKCQKYLKGLQSQSSQLQMIKAIIQSVVQEQECTGKEVGFGFQQSQIGAGKYEQCAQESQVQVTIAYQLISVRSLLSRLPETTSRSPIITNTSATNGSIKVVDNSPELSDSELNELIAAQQKRKALEKREQELKAKLRNERERTFNTLIAQKKQKASKQWRLIQVLRDGGGPEAIKAVSRFITQYEKSEITLKDIEGQHSRKVTIPEVALAKKWYEDNTIEKYSLKWYEKKCNNGSSSYCFDLGKFYDPWNDTSARMGSSRWKTYKKLGLMKSTQKSIRWYKKGCEQKHLSSCNNLGTMYDTFKSNLNIQSNTNTAATYYIQGCELGSSTACKNLGDLFDPTYPKRPHRKDAKTSARWYQKSCDLGHAEGCYRYATLYNTSAKTPGLRKDVLKARDFYIKGCNKGYTASCYEYATLYDSYTKTPGLRKDVLKARDFYIKACNKKHSTACWNLGAIYHKSFSKRSGIAKDAKKAQPYFDKACQYANKQQKTKNCKYSK